VTAGEGKTIFQPGYSSVGYLRAAPEPSAAANESVECVRLDDFIGERGNVRLLKIDVQGTELDVLQSAEEGLRRGKIDLIFLEFSAETANTAAYLSDLGYLLVDTAYLLLPSRDTDLRYWDVLGKIKLSTGSDAAIVWPKAAGLTVKDFVDIVKQQSSRTAYMQTDLICVAPHFREDFFAAVNEISTLGCLIQESRNHATVDECAAVAFMQLPFAGSSGVMFDVGAHFGTSARPFVEAGWNVHCFEPDPENFAALQKNLGARPNIALHNLALAQASATSVPLYRSVQSTGISGLHAFHDSHKAHGHVDITTVARVCEDHGITHIDVLKIDVEGYDYFVLQGVPWLSIKPSVVLAEFEDAKTRPLGHTTNDVADFLADRGYTVYVSEWHPIVRYGVEHDWHTLKRYPCRFSEAAWGNLIAFREDPGFAAFAEAIKKTLRLRW
jgi:FkbM family methyltransferase